MNHFDLAYLAAAPFFFANAKLKQWRHGKYRRSLPGMFGHNWPSPPLPRVEKRVWLHSVSVGETVAAGAFLRALHRHHPGWEYLSTTTTETGQEQSQRSLPDAKYRDFAPADFSWTVRGFLNAYRPTVYIFFETEIWPNILLECRRQRIPAFLVNAKLSERSGRNYRLGRPLLRKPLSALHAVLAQTDADAERYRALVGDEVPVHVTGNLKFDGLPTPLNEQERTDWRRELGGSDDVLLFIAGSTHPTEEVRLWDAFQLYRQRGGPPARLVIAPRHPERFEAVAEELRKAGATVSRLSQPSGDAAPADVVLLDRMGVLARAFGAADIALVGGAWKPVGGHNLLEPGVHGIPVLHGPHMHAQKEIMRIVRAGNATLTVDGQEEIADALLRLTDDPDERRQLGRAARTAAQSNAGAAERSVRLVLESLARNA